jgi:hypothetical protein
MQKRQPWRQRLLISSEQLLIEQHNTLRLFYTIEEHVK